MCDWKPVSVSNRAARLQRPRCPPGPPAIMWKRATGSSRVRRGSEPRGKTSSEPAPIGVVDGDRTRQWRGHNAPCSPVHHDHHRLGAPPANRTPCPRLQLGASPFGLRCRSGTGGRNRTLLCAGLEPALTPRRAGLELAPGPGIEPGASCLTGRPLHRGGLPGKVWSGQPESNRASDCLEGSWAANAPCPRLVPTLRIELRSCALQARAWTTIAKSA